MIGYKFWSIFETFLGTVPPLEVISVNTDLHVKTSTTPDHCAKNRHDLSSGSENYPYDRINKATPRRSNSGGDASCPGSSYRHLTYTTAWLPVAMDIYAAALRLSYLSASEPKCGKSEKSTFVQDLQGRTHL